MKRTHLASLFAAAAVLAAVPAAAQQGGNPKPATPPAQQKMQQKGGEFALPTFVMAPIGAKAAVRNDQGQTLGSIRDHVIDAKTGKLLFVAVTTATGDETSAHLVPFRRFQWNADQQAFVLPIAAEELAAMPVYDPQELMGGDTMNADAKASGQAGKALVAAKPKSGESSVAATRLVDGAIMTGSNSFAAVDGLVLEPNRGVVAFVLAGSSNAADPYVIPWQALTWKHATEGEEQGHFTIERSAEQLAKAPMLEGADLTRLRRPDDVKRIFAFYDLKPPHAAGGADGAGARSATGGKNETQGRTEKNG